MSAAFQIADQSDFKVWQLQYPKEYALLKEIIFIWRSRKAQVRGMPGKWAADTREDWLKKTSRSRDQWKHQLRRLEKDGLLLRKIRSFAGRKNHIYLQPTLLALTYVGRPADLERVEGQKAPNKISTLASQSAPQCAPQHAPQCAPVLSLPSLPFHHTSSSKSLKKDSSLCDKGKVKVEGVKPATKDEVLAILNETEIKDDPIPETEVKPIPETKGVSDNQAVASPETEMKSSPETKGVPETKVKPGVKTKPVSNKKETPHSPPSASGAINCTDDVELFPKLPCADPSKVQHPSEKYPGWSGWSVEVKGKVYGGYVQCVENVNKAAGCKPKTKKGFGLGMKSCAQMKSEEELALDAEFKLDFGPDDDAYWEKWDAEHEASPASCN